MPKRVATTDDTPESVRRAPTKAWTVKTVYAGGQALDKGDRFSLNAAAGPIVVGRDPEKCSFILADDRVSKRHARFRTTPRGWAIEDCDSRHGTFVDGERIAALASLKHDSIVRLGNTLVVVCHEEDVVGGGPLGELAGDSAAIRRVRSQLHRAASHDDSVYLFGETGTGKELCARALHQASARARGPFIAVNCPAVMQSVFEREMFGHVRGAFTGASEDQPGYCRAAHGGTLFLDEFGELGGTEQAKLLRVIQEKAVIPVGSTKPVDCDIRIVVATNSDLDSLVEEGAFRRDLFERVSQTAIVIPPLRERRSDILSLVARLSGGECLPVLDARLAQAMMLFDWPGNVRRLENVVKRIKRFDPASSDDIGFVENFIRENLPDPKPDPSSADIAAALSAHKGNESRVAKQLGIHRSRLQRLIKRYQLRREGESADDQRSDV